MIDQVKRLWQASQPSDQRCPGEKDCEDFERAGGPGISYEEQCHACLTCPKKETKLKANRRDLLERFALRVEYIVRRRDSGYPLKLSEMSAIELEGVLIWDTKNDFYERSIKMFGLKLN